MNSLDLHGIKHIDVPRKVDEFIWDAMSSNKKEVEIITGLSEEMKKIVISTLNDYNLTCETDLLNKGKLLIKL